MFRQEIKRKNQMIEDLLMRQEKLELQVSRLHQVMEYDQDGTPTYPKSNEVPEPKE